MSWWTAIRNLFQKTVSKPGWNFEVLIDGDDLVVNNTAATWFGGDNDSQDNGLTASGVHTAGNPQCMGCALPVIVRDAEGKLMVSTYDSPLAVEPHIPWKTQVKVTRAGVSITVPLIDNGPTKSSGHGIDLTQAAFRALGVPLRSGVALVSYRVIGGAKYLNA